MRGFRETAFRAVNKVTGKCRKKKHNSKEALASIRGQLLAGERKALENLQEYGYTVTAADVVSVENAYNHSTVASLVVGEQKAHQNQHEPVHVVQPIIAATVGCANSFQSLKAQLLATDYDTLDALHNSIFGTIACVDDTHSPQSIEAPLVAEEPKALRIPCEPVFAAPAATPALVETVCNLQPVKTCDTRQKRAMRSKVRIVERNRRDLRREYRQMAAAQKRVDEHRARRAEKASSGIPLCGATTKPSTKPSSTQPLISPSCVVWSNLAHDKSFYENQTDEESRKYVQERLMSILGPQRMKFELLPSGHNPVDPAIADYNQQAATNRTLEQWEDYKTELRRQEEKQKCQAEKEEAERVRIEILLNHYRERYVNRLERLALYGPDLTKGIDLIEAALLASDHNEAASVMLALSNQVLLPIHGLLIECKQEIPLEEVGAEKLKGVWPLERLEAMYFCLKGQLDFFPEALDMLQGIGIICMAIRNPTPFHDPLAPKQIPAANSCISLPIITAELATNTLPSEGLTAPGTASAPAPAGSGFAKLLQAATQAANAEQQKDSAPASNGFAKLLAATAEAVNAQQQKESAPASSGYSKLLGATADKFNGTQEAAPDVTSINTAQPESAARAAVLQYIATDNMYFETEVQDLIKRDTVVGIHRRNAIKCMKELVDLANGEKGILGDMDAGSFRCQIETCGTKIDTLKGAARLNKETQALRKLCGSALMLWSVYTRGTGPLVAPNCVEKTKDVDWVTLNKTSSPTMELRLS